MSILSGTLGAVKGSAAQEKAADLAKVAQDTATQAQLDMYAQARADQGPYRGLGQAVLPIYQSALTGQPVSYKDPSYGEPMDITQVRAQNLDPNKMWYKDPATGKPIDASQVPSMTTSYNPEASPSYKYLAQESDKTLGRALAARGLSGSGQAATAVSDARSKLLSEDYWKRLSLLGGAIDVGRGAQSATAAAGGQYAAGQQAGAQNLGNVFQQSGQAQAGLYSGLGGAGAQTASAGLKLYDYGKTAGWWGAGTAAGGIEAGTAAAEMANSPPVTAMLAA